MSSNNKVISGSSSLPARMWMHVFSLLPLLEGLSRVSRVSKAWCVLAASDQVWKNFNIVSLFPLLRTIDADTWITHIDCEKFGFDPTGAPTYQKAAVKADILFLRQLFPRVEGNAGVTMLTLPKGLNLIKLIEGAKSPKTGNPVDVSCYLEPILKDLGGKTLNETVRIFITNNILEGSREKISIEEDAMVSAAGGERTQTLATVALLILTFMKTGERLCPEKPSTENDTYMHTSDVVRKYTVCVGAFSENRITITKGSYYCSPNGGVGVQRTVAAART
jgi:hypothetical protein